MDFIFDENFPKRLKKWFMKKGHNVKLLHELNALGISNGDVANYAISHQSIILTNDSDFLNMKKDVQLQVKVIYFKIHPRTTEKIRELLNKYLINVLKLFDRPIAVQISETGYKIV
jgi:predicted nuclease of predicted toxin-antitoxin system